MDLDLLLGLVALAIGTALSVWSAPLAHGLREGDEQWRERHPWTAQYEPQTTLTASDRGRFLILRAWLLGSAAGFVVVGAGLVVRTGIV
jgi:hypothetical protein